MFKPETQSPDIKRDDMREWDRNQPLLYGQEFNWVTPTFRRYTDGMVMVEAFLVGESLLK